MFFVLGPGDGGDLRAGCGGELDLSPAYSAVGAGDQDAAAEQVTGEPERAQGGQAGQRQGSGLFGAYSGGQRGQPGWRGRRPAAQPACSARATTRVSAAGPDPSRAWATTGPGDSGRGATRW